MDCPFVNSKQGVAKWGGWLDAGQNLFKEVRAKVQDARDRPHVAEMEADCLKRLRLEHGLDRPEGEEPPKVARRRTVCEDSDDNFAEYFNPAN